MKVALMIEGQDGVSWDGWLALARTAEAHGFDALFRSDHYGTREHAALDAWGTVNALAAVTERIRLGTLVSPVTFRPAAVLAKLVLTADHVSGGRVEVGMGTGWWQAEHELFGLPFPPMGERMAELERQTQEVRRIWRETAPPPVRQPHPRLLLGGEAKPRGARLAARFADEYNVTFRTPEACREKHAALAEACEREGRDPATLAFSVMLGIVIGADEAEARRRGDRLVELGRGDDFSGPGWLYGTPEQVVDRLGEYEAAGVQRVMLQHLLHEDVDAVSLIGEAVIPAVAG
jgi:alkanesulfonate monooxygenase SsuD/methylene tetrahydromethanopterin reductase-like flavin-dependent oxidoreductase (luciferase family)